jgi:thioredoxin-dependent peroxiredoxin
MLAEGEAAPDFELESDEGSIVRLAEFRGRPVVLYFYPKDDTPGCTRQACAFRDLENDFRSRGAVVLGASTDDVESHRKFKERYGLPFTLLADPDHKLADAYGVWGEREYRGRSYWGVQRSTFVIDADGKVLRAMYGVNPDRNPGEVLEALPEPAGAPSH